MTSLNTIESEIADLPLNLRAEVLDFVQFVKQLRLLSRFKLVAEYSSMISAFINSVKND